MKQDGFKIVVFCYIALIHIDTLSIFTYI